MTSEISNPFSTGGGGQFFEAKVQASFLLLMLVGGRVPCLPSGNIQSVRLQAKQAGFETDDVVVTVLADTGIGHRLWLIKHHAVVSTSDKEFHDSLSGAWSDFHNPSVFERKRAISLVTLPLRVY